MKFIRRGWTQEVEYSPNSSNNGNSGIGINQNKIAVKTTVNLINTMQRIYINHYQ